MSLLSAALRGLQPVFEFKVREEQLLQVSSILVGFLVVRCVQGTFIPASNCVFVDREFYVEFPKARALLFQFACINAALVPRLTPIVVDFAAHLLALFPRAGSDKGLVLYG